MTDGRFVTRGILFDVNKATPRPESMGVINEVAKRMKADPELNLSIEGHTDSDGEKDFNFQAPPPIDTPGDNRYRWTAAGN
jgi:outer membrane protein OmpA-like peptidoglycan-associated protein